MKPISKRTLVATVLATAIAGLSVTAIAQGMGATMNPELHAQHMAQRSQGGPDAQTLEQHQQQRLARMQAMHAERQARLKADLKITPAQEAAWNAYVARSTPTPPKAAPAEDWSRLTTPQRLDRMQALKAERDAAMDKRIDATRSFYAQLTPEQQKVFDAQGGGFHRAGMKGEHPMGGRGGHGGHGRHGGGQPGMGGMGCGMGAEGGPMPGGMPGPRS